MMITPFVPLIGSGKGADLPTWPLWVIGLFFVWMLAVSINSEYVEKKPKRKRK